MKVEGFGSIGSTTNVGKRKGVSGTGNFADVLAAAEGGEAAQAGQASEVAAPAAMSSLLALQEIPDDYVQRRKLVQQGNNMLDVLEKLRRQLLVGSLPLHVLKDIEQQIVQQKQLVNDPKLNEIIADIELRAAVELAKLEQAIADSGNSN